MSGLVDTLVELARVPSVTGSERALRDLIQAEVGGTAVADSLVVGEGGPGTLLLVGHLDTVPAQGNQEVTVSAGRVHGLGTTDMKAGLAVMIHLLRAGGAVAGVFYAGEEGPLSGNQLPLVLAEAPQLLRADAAVVLEPTDRAIEAGCQGVVNAEVVFSGRAAHSARPWLGENAISKAGWFLERLHALPPEDHVVSGLSFREVMSVTMAAGGVARNVIPAEFTLQVNYRFAPDRSVESAMTRLEEVCAGVDRLRILDAAPAGPVASDYPLFRRLAETSGAEVKPKQGWTDVATLAAAGLPAVNFGPGEPGLAHRPDESVRIEDLDWAYQAILATLPG